MDPTQRAKTLVEMFARRVADDAAREALLVKQDEGEKGGRNLLCEAPAGPSRQKGPDPFFTAITWDQLGRQVRRLAAGLVRVGVRPGDRVAQVSENRHEWIVADLAIQMARAVHVPIHATLAGPQILWQVIDSEAVAVLLSTREQAEKLAGLADRLPKSLELVAYDDGIDSIGDRGVRQLADLTAMVSDDEAERAQSAALRHVQEGDLATILYTSGTTGEPKGVMLSQRNLASNTWATLEAFAIEPDDLRLCFLPLSHVFARTCDLYTWIASGSRLALAGSRESVLADCALVRPTVLNGVPYFYDKVARGLEQAGVADRPGALREMLGGRVRICCCGGAALPVHLAEFFCGRQVPLVEGYGLTETSPVITASSPQANRSGCVGPALPGVEVRISDDGEVLTRGPHVMLGYWKRPDETAATIVDGWCRTGDLGQIDEDGFLRITGRKKELIVTAAGKNVAPVYLESLLTQDPLIAQALVVGDGRAYLAALLVPDPEVLRGEIAARKIAVGSPAEAVAHPQVRALFRERIDRRLAEVSRQEQVREFTVLARGFTVDSGELTPTLKLRRGVIEANLAEQIEAMYNRPQG